MTDVSPTARTRRETLALAGAALGALSGCAGVENPFASEPEPVTISGSALSSTFDDEVAAITDPLPVTVETSYAEAQRSHVRELLSSVPTPLDASDVPNGAIRSELSAAYEEATGALDEADSAESPLPTLAALRDAREHAREVAAGWAAIDEGLTTADVATETEPISARAREFRERWRYVGQADDPTAALLVHADVEDRVGTAVRSLERIGHSRGPTADESPVAVGELAADVEQARASLSDARYLYDRFESSIERATRFGRPFRSVDESLAAALDDRVAALPTDEDATLTDEDAADAPIGHAISDLRRGVRHRNAGRDRETGRRASAVLSVAHDSRSARALAALEDRVERGAYVTVTSVDDVTALRRRAITATESVAETDRRPCLSRRLGAHLPASITSADEDVERYVGEESVEVRWVRRGLGRYVTAAAMARATPAVAEDVASALDAASA